MALKAFEGLQSNGCMAFAVNAFIGMVNEEKIGGINQNFVFPASSKCERRTIRAGKRFLLLFGMS